MNQLPDHPSLRRLPSRMPRFLVLVGVYAALVFGCSTERLQIGAGLESSTGGVAGGNQAGGNQAGGSATGGGVGQGGPGGMDCLASGASCERATECCSLSCLRGECAAACIADGGRCAASDECCGGRCESGSCVALNQDCKTAGNPCQQDGQCCSLLCREGTCDQAGSFCAQAGDLCAANDECCTGNCEIETERSVGICGDVPDSPSRCNAKVAGQICEGCNDCCSRLCVPFGDSGMRVCQASAGCRLTGETCRSDRDCCGGTPGANLPGAGNVTCFKDDGREVGICRNPMSCSPQGSVCAHEENTCNPSGSPANCCGGEGQSGACRLDQFGVPRCNSLDECRQPDQACASASDCCSGLCVPDDDMGFVCAQGECRLQTESCSISSDCCPGLECQAPVGATSGSCLLAQDGAAGAACRAYGQTCEEAGQCCGDIPCSDGRCVEPLQ